MKILIYKKIILGIIILLCAIFSFYKLGEKPLERWDEQTNAWVVQETINSGSFPVLKYENKPFFEKPPVWYYSTIGIVKIFGLNNISLRLVSAISNVLLLSLILYFCIKKFDFKVAFFAGITYITTRHLFISGPAGIFSTHTARSADLDLLQFLFMFISIYFCVVFEQNRSKKSLALIGLFTGLAFMTKGGMALLPVAILGIWEVCKVFKGKKIINLQLSFSNLKTNLYFLVPFLLIVLPWHLMLYIKYGNRFLNEYFSYHYVNRYVNAIEGHSESIFFHFKNLFNFEFFSSGYILILGLIYILVVTKLKDFKYFMLFTYSVLVLGIVTIMQTKLAWYLLYIYPVGVTVCGVFYGFLFEKIRKTLLR